MWASKQIYRIPGAILSLLVLASFAHGSSSQPEFRENLSTNGILTTSSEQIENNTKIIWVHHPIIDDQLMLEVIVESDEEVGKVRFSRWDAETSQVVDIGIVYNPPYIVEMDTSSITGFFEVRIQVYDPLGNTLAHGWIWIYKEEPPNYSYLAIVFRPDS